MQTTAIRGLESSDSRTKWSWSCRGIDRSLFHVATELEGAVPMVGDLALFEVKGLGYHDTVVLADNRKVRIYPGDFIVGVFGNRYATDAYEAEVTGTTDLGLLTAGGMVGTVLSKHHDMQGPTKLDFVGYLANPAGERANLKELRFRRSVPSAEPKNLVVVVGTGMNSGKTTTARKLIRGLSEMGLKVAAFKLTGSVSNRDQDEMKSASATFTADFSDYGFPSTYLATKEELMGLFSTMLADAEGVNPDVTVMEIADGILERETTMLLNDDSFKRKVAAIVLSAENSLSGVYGSVLLQRMGYRVSMVSGMMTSSPLYVREFMENRSEVPVVSSAGNGEPLAEAMRDYLHRWATTPNDLELQGACGIEGEVYDYGLE